MDNKKVFSTNGLSGDLAFLVEVDEKVSALLEVLEKKNLSPSVVYRVVDCNCIAIQVFVGDPADTKVI